VDYQCPICFAEFDAIALQRPSGVTGASYCPNCKGRVQVSLPYGKPVAVISVLIAWGLLALMRVKTAFGIIFGTVLIWIPLSLYMNALLFRYRAPTLKKWEPRKQSKQRRIRSLFEWLSERDAPPELIDKRK
jgi:hypothetical protein